MTENANSRPEHEPPGEDATRAAEVALQSRVPGEQDPTVECLSESSESRQASESPVETPTVGSNMGVVLDIPVQLSLELGRTRVTIRDLLQLGEGSVVKLDRPPGEPLDIFVNDCLVARGEVVVVNDRFGMRITDIVSPEERLKRLR